MLFFTINSINKHQHTPLYFNPRQYSNTTNNSPTYIVITIMTGDLYLHKFNFKLI